MIIETEKEMWVMIILRNEAKVPRNWHKFLTNAENKTELFAFLSKRIQEEDFPDEKDVYATMGDKVLHNGKGSAMPECDHEEADTRIVVHALHALQASSTGMVFTGDTDVVVIFLSNFHHFKAVNPCAEIWIAFRSGKNTKMLHLNTIAANLGPVNCRGMAMFHAFTGCDSTSSFKFKGKRYCCKVMKMMPHLMQHFASVAETPFQISRSLMETVNEFVCKLYSSSDVPENDVNKLRMRIFFTKDKRCRTNSTHNGCIGTTYNTQCVPG